MLRITLSRCFEAESRRATLAIDEEAAKRGICGEAPQLTYTSQRKCHLPEGGDMSFLRSALKVTRRENGGCHQAQLVILATAITASAPSSATASVTSPPSSRTAKESLNKSWTRRRES
jgi:hypothetical protein